MRAFVAAAMLIAAPLSGQSPTDPTPILGAALTFSIDSMPGHIAIAATDRSADIVLLSDRVRVSAAGPFRDVDPAAVAHAAGIERLARYSETIVCDLGDISMYRCRIVGACVGLAVNLFMVAGSEAQASVAYHYRLPNGRAGFRADTLLLVREERQWRVREIIETVVS